MITIQSNTIKQLFYDIFIELEKAKDNRQKNCASNNRRSKAALVELLEADLLGVLPEATTAHVQAVLANQTMVVAAHTARIGRGSWK